jgi:DNA-binding protein H-NS
LEIAISWYHRAQLFVEAAFSIDRNQNLSTDKQALEALRAKKAEIDAQIKAQETAMLDGVIAQVRATIREFGLTSSQLFGAGRSAGAKKGKTVAYRDANGNTWSGGRGRVPDWVKAVRSSGGDMEKYRA